MSMPMKCWWTARAELGVGMAIVFGGVLLLLSYTRKFRSGIATMILALSVLAAAMPLWLIGVCEAETMRCHMIMQPALLVISALSGFSALVVAVGNRGKQ